MENLWDKYNRIKEVFYRDFVYDSSYTEQASCIPLSSVKNGVGWVGDGTINLAQYLQLVYTEMILGYKTKDDVRNAILVLTRLADTTYDLFFNSNKGIYFKFEKGFFLRDDIHGEDANKFGLTKISSGYTNGEEYGVIKGQGHTTRDFGESGGKRNAGGGSGETNTGVVFQGGISDYSEGSGTGGSTNGSGKGGGYGGGGGGVRYSMVYAGAGGDGTVLIRGRRYKS